jgi:tetratricopeptide (TPR) repeat protein
MNRPPIHRRLALALLLAASPALFANDDSEWFDVEGRIQYGFYTEDTRTLTNLSEQLASTTESSDPLRSYYAAFANYRLAMLWSARDTGRARAAIERCVENLGHALKARKDFPEALALHAACLETRADQKPWTAPLSASKRSSHIERALKLAPKNPRVLLLDALETRDASQAVAQLKKAVSAFEAERQDVGRAPGWGAAEAYLQLGRTYLEVGAVLEAREAFERALVIAPEFVQARRALSNITSG